MAEQSPKNKNTDHDRQEQDGREGKRPNGPGSGGKGPGGPKQPNFMSKGMIGWIVLIGALIVLLVLFNNIRPRAKELNVGQFMALAKQHKFKGPVVVKDGQIVGELKQAPSGQSASGNASKYRSITIDPNNKTWYFLLLEQADQTYKEDPGNSIWMQLLVTWGPFILLAVLAWFFIIRSLRSAGGGPGMLGNFGRSKHKVLTKEHSDITLDDIAGIQEAKEEVGEMIEFLKNPKKFQRLGGRVPRGVLLIGAPGCGKTLLAKAVAGEAEVPFFSISGSDFVEMFVGVGASRVRDLFKQAKEESSACIIFLDEIDAVGRKRGAGFSSGGHDEREQTLNAILVEMDGFDSSDHVIVMAATNRADVLDPALTRPGRFDRQIDVPLPDIKGRMEILRVHSKKVKLSPDVDLEKLARGTPMFSGAELAAIINEGAIGATLQGKEFVEQDDLEEARDKVKWGRARRSHTIEEDEKKVIAYHEAGHAIIMYFDPQADPLHKVTIIPRGQGLGTTFMLPEKDRHIYQRNHLLAQMRVTFGGRISEQMFCGDISSGAAMDIRQATSIARAMITEYGMSEKLGFQRFGADESRNPWDQPDKLISDETTQLIDEEVSTVINRTYEEASDMLSEHREQLQTLAEALLKYETLSKEEVDQLMRGEPLTKATVSDLIEAEKQQGAQKTRRDEGDTIQPEDAGLDHDTPGGALPSPA